MTMKDRTFVALHEDPMATATISFDRPLAGEFNPFYDRYISLVPSSDIVGLLQSQAPETVKLFQSANSKADFRYAPGKWSVKEMLGHINDTERIMTYRALRVARGDKTPLAGFEQDDYIRDGNFAQRTLPDLLDEFLAVRQASLALFRHVDSQTSTRQGIANGDTISVRALAYIIAGHELHHRKVLREKYL
jgi:DinB superfamily